MIRRLKISGFKRLRDVDLEMRPLMVLIGANGVGKTSLLDAVGMLSAAGDRQLGDFVMSKGGIAPLLSKCEDCREISVDTCHEKKRGGGGEQWRYGITLKEKAYDYYLSREELTVSLDDQPVSHKYIDAAFPEIRYMLNGETLSAKPGSVTAHETYLSQTQLPYSGEMTKFLSTGYFSASRFDVFGEVSRPQPVVPADSPGSDGANLVSYLYNMRETRPDVYKEYEDIVGLAAPEFQKLSFPPVANGMLGMYWQEKGLNSPLPPGQLSAGIIRFLWLLGVLLNPDPPSVTLIDEPEASLHPDMLRYLAELLRGASLRTQVIVATQSDRLVSLLEPSEVAVMDCGEKGAAGVTWADSMNISAWLEDYSLGKVWRMGILGGRAR